PADAIIGLGVTTESCKERARNVLTLDMKDDKIEAAVAIDIGEGNAGSLGFAPEVAGDGYGITPMINLPLAIQSPADTVEAHIRTCLLLDMEDKEVGTTGATDRGDGHTGTVRLLAEIS